MSADSISFFKDSSFTASSILFDVPDEDVLDAMSMDLIKSTKLYRDIRSLPAMTNPRAIRHLLDTYLELQQLRLSVAATVRHLTAQQLPVELFTVYLTQLRQLEASFVRPMDIYARASVPGRWTIAQRGLGPVYTAGLLAHLDITKAPTAGSLWRYAGLDPTATKRSFNPELKTLTLKIGHSFVRHAAHPDCFYGQLYRTDRDRRLAKNTAGDYAALATQLLSTEDPAPADVGTLRAGHLPDSHIDAQARRFAVKIFLSHYHAVAYQDYHGVPSDRPTTIDRGDGPVEIMIPHFPF